ncbi:PRA1 family protein 2 [Lingula anatina]|uniref:PRA1 family protein n=1 Tax=Lingula anatina TaxID=7574 RepID=A0A1S3KAX4_LINAN|nr:PRA1 family protein 2 [Lingula anatina]|eukprot:XP_013419780.1 PRA1 family protein 2 [Lingula anatina]
MDEVELAPLRPLSDFLLESARFQVPSLRDPTRWNNRMINNLLYYQTNYFLSAVVIFLIIGVLHPVKMVIGVLAVAVVFSVFVYATNNKAATRHFKKDHPLLCMGGVLFGGYLLVYMAGAVIVFLFGIALPLFLILLHSSLRMRNVKNRFTNIKMEYGDIVGMKRTPMNLILDALGQQPEVVAH